MTVGRADTPRSLQARPPTSWRRRHRLCKFLPVEGDVVAGAASIFPRPSGLMLFLVWNETKHTEGRAEGGERLAVQGWAPAWSHC